MRRHSISLRSPPAGSIASDILLSTSSQVTNATTLHLERSMNLLANLKDFSEQLSEFGSARESLTSSSDEENTSEADKAFSTGNDRGFKNKKKRKHSRTPPSRDSFLKKANVAS